MAFAATTPLPLGVRAPQPASCRPPSMSVTPSCVGRRAALQLLVAGAVLGARRAVRADVESLKSLKEDLGKIQYEDEVTEAGPDPVAENVTRAKKGEEVPGFRLQNEELLAGQAEKRRRLLEKEKKQLDAIRSQFLNM